MVASFPVVLDADGTIAEQFQAVPLPATFVPDAQGVARHKIIGATTMTALKAKITAVIGGGCKLGRHVNKTQGCFSLK